MCLASTCSANHVVWLFLFGFLIVINKDELHIEVDIKKMQDMVKQNEVWPDLLLAEIA